MSVSLYGEATVSPGDPDVNDNESQGLNLGLTIAASVAGTYTHVGWWAALTNPPGTATWSGRIWTPTHSDTGGGTGTAVAFSEFIGAPTTGAWNWIELLSGGYHAEANEAVRATLHQGPDAGGGNPSSILRYVATSGGHTSAITNGVLRAPADAEASGLVDGGNWNQGTYKYASREFYANETFGSGQYFVDVRFVPDVAGDNGRGFLSMFMPA